MCTQETWIKPTLDFVIEGYSCIHKDRPCGSGGGCATFIRPAVIYKQLTTVQDLDIIAIEVWTKEGTMKIINFYNPCKRLEKHKLESILDHWRRKVF